MDAGAASALEGAEDTVFTVTVAAELIVEHPLPLVTTQ